MKYVVLLVGLLVSVLALPGLVAGFLWAVSCTAFDCGRKLLGLIAELFDREWPRRDR